MQYYQQHISLHTISLIHYLQLREQINENDTKKSILTHPTIKSSPKNKTRKYPLNLIFKQVHTPLLKHQNIYRKIQL